MQIVSGLTGVTQKNDIQVQKPISHLLIVKSGTVSGISHEYLQATIKGREIDQVISPKLKISDLALISQFGNGYMLRQSGTGGILKSSYLIEISGGGSLNFAEQEYLSVGFEDLEAGAVYDIYGFESLTEYRAYIKYQSDNIPAGDPTSRIYVLGESTKMLAIKNNGALAKITLTGNNGKQVTYYPEELQAIAREQNGMTVGPDTLVEGDMINQVIAGASTDFFFIPTVEFKSFELFTNNNIALNFIKTTIFSY